MKTKREQIMQRHDHWQWKFSYRPAWWNGAGWRELTIGVFKVIRQPAPGDRFRRGDYRGFLLWIRIWLPWEIQRD